MSQMTIATAPRKSIPMKFRGLAAYFLGRAARRYAPRYHVKSIRIIPKINNQKDFKDLLARVAWYLPSDVTVYIQTELDSEIRIPKNVILCADAGPSADLIIAWKWSASARLSNLHRLGRTLIGDPWFYSTVECETWTHCFNRVSSKESSAIDDISTKNWSLLRAEHVGKPISYLFTTGPSIATTRDWKYRTDSVRIICNSMVKDREFLDRTPPHILVFADPVFHFSPNPYASEFRKMAIDTITRYKCYCIVPRSTAALMLHHYPGISDKLIAMALHDRQSPSLPTERELEVKATGNILTQFMLPVAGAISKHAAVLGADGRKPDENYFWKHNPSTQIGDLMSEAESFHPSFFRDRDYVDYYDQHCARLESVAKLLERSGVKVSTLTPSHIPALRNRQVDPSGLLDG